MPEWFKEPENLFETFQDKDKARKTGNINLKVWTVGEDYPVAYHISIKSGNLESSREYENARLGYGSSGSVPESVRESISKLIDDLAVSFFKARGEI